MSLPLVAGLLLTQLFLRGSGWHYDWLWAFYNYHFVLVMLGPAIAGIACLEGRRWSGSADLLLLSVRPSRGAVAIATATFSVVGGLYLLGLLVASGLVLHAGTPGRPSAAALATLAPALFMLFAFVAVGIAVGLRWTAWPVAPLLAAGLFGLVLFAYGNGLESLVRVGGATAALPNISPRAKVQVLQCLTYALVAAACLVRPIRAAAPGTSGRTRAAFGLSVLALISGFVVAGQESVFEASPAKLICVGAEPVLCLAPNFLHLESDIRAAVAPGFSRARLLLPEVQGYTQEDFATAPRGLATFYPLDVLREPASSARLILNAIFNLKTCAALGDRDVDAAFGRVSSWLAESSDPVQPPPDVRAAVQNLSLCAKK